jgi:esterase/lipase superfamily enzyme
MYLAFLALFFFLCTTATMASDLAPQLLRIPVLFVTDRNQAPNPKFGGVDFGPHRKYIGDCKHDPFMGTAYCVIQNTEKKKLTDNLKALGWTAAEPQDKVTNTMATAYTGDSFEANEKQLYGTIHKEALLTPDKTFFVFAHGYKYVFRRALFSAAKLAYYAERPLILYSWPSVGKLRSYSSDENNVEWSQDHFNDMVVQLEKLCADDPSVHIRMMAHSMGNRLVVRACPLLREQKCFTEFALICPDIDDGLVQHYARRYLSANGTAEIRLYMSEKDKALAFSQLIHGGYTRFGECADALGSVITQALSTGQKQGDAKDESDADKEFQQRLKQRAAHMQTIDFTNIDLGWMGHSIPAKMICSMSYTDTPGAGLKLIKQESGQRGKTANYFSKLTKTIIPTPKDDQVLHAGTCLRVVKLNGPANTVALKTTPAESQ